MSRCGARHLVIIMALLVTGGIVASALEVEGPNHEDEIHHCAACCITKQSATPVSDTQPQSLTIVVRQAMSEPQRFASQTVIRRLVPPPKSLA